MVVVVVVVVGKKGGYAKVVRVEEPIVAGDSSQSKRFCAENTPKRRNRKAEQHIHT